MKVLKKHNRTIGREGQVYANRSRISLMAWCLVLLAANVDIVITFSSLTYFIESFVYLATNGVFTKVLWVISLDRCSACGS